MQYVHRYYVASCYKVNVAPSITSVLGVIRAMQKWLNQLDFNWDLDSGYPRNYKLHGVQIDP